MTYNKDEYFTFYKGIRNRFRKFDHADMVSRIWTHVNNVPNPFNQNEIALADKKYKNFPWHPWSDLLLLKWILVDDHFLKPHRRIAPDSLIYELLTEMFNATASTGHLETKSNPTLFLRATANQQFMYQASLDAGKLLRQFKFFSNLDSNHSLRISFKNQTGLEIEEVLFLNFILAGQCLSSAVQIPIQWQMFTKFGLGECKIRKYVNLMSGTMLQLHDHLKKTKQFSKPGRNPNEHYEKSPLISKPIIWRTSSNLYPIHRSILFRSIENYIYNYLRTMDVNLFMSKFGKPIFEKYVLNLIKKSGSNFYTEKEILGIYKSIGKASSKIVDFIVREDNMNILIDAKGVSPNLNAMVSSNPDTVRQGTRSSVLKAISQANETVDALKNIQDTSVFNKNSECVLLVVTYEDLMLGSGVAYAEIVDSVEFDLQSESISFNAIHFVDIGNFEQLCNSVAKGERTFSDVISHAKSDGNCIHTRKMSFSMHLNELNIPTHEDAVEALFNEILILWQNFSGETVQIPPDFLQPNRR